MAYTPNTLRLVTSDIEGTVGRLWFYTTASDADATVTGASYFSDGASKGMQVGDLVDVVATTGPKYKKYQVASLSGTAATVATPTAIT
jgi:hypothetical protein